MWSRAKAKLSFFPAAVECTEHGSWARARARVASDPMKRIRLGVEAGVSHIRFNCCIFHIPELLLSPAAPDHVDLVYYTHAWQHCLSNQRC